MNTSMPVRVNVRIEVVDATGRTVSVQERHNLVTLAGRDLARDLLVGDSAATVTHFAVGTGSTAVAAGDTSLGSEVYREAITQTSTSSGAIEFKHYLPSTEANGVDLTEAGLLTATSGGVLFARVVFAAISKTASVGVTFTWTVSIGAS